LEEAYFTNLYKANYEGVLLDCPEASGTIKAQSSRITHTWTRDKGQWKLLGGMSSDILKE